MHVLEYPDDCDNYSSIYSRAFVTFVKGNGIEQIENPYPPQANGTVENALKTVKKATRSLTLSSTSKEKKIFNGLSELHI